MPKVESPVKSKWSDSDIAFMDDLESREFHEMLRDEEKENPTSGQSKGTARHAPSSDGGKLRPGA